MDSSMVMSLHLMEAGETKDGSWGRDGEIAREREREKRQRDVYRERKKDKKIIKLAIL